MTDSPSTPPPPPPSKKTKKGSAPPPPPPPPPAKKYGLGHRPSASPSDWKASARLGAPAQLPPDASLQQFVRRVNDQGQTESCVGQALTKAIDTRLRKLGINVDEPSAQAAYTGGRELEVGPDGQLTDTGSVAADVFKFLRDIGVAREQVWPLDPAKINEKLPWDVLQDASHFLLFQWWRIYESGVSRSDAIANALAQGFPVVFAQQVDNKFFSYSGGTILALDADDAGGHMMCILGYRTRKDGTREFLVINSWGINWGESGYCWMHERVLADPRSDEFYIVEIHA
jgi:Papain family cysteine protease